MRWLLLLAYTCSGLAGLVYQVSWTRLLTLYIGHTTAAASAVVAAFLGGLAVGAALGGAGAARVSPRRSLQGYAVLEIVVAAIALILPYGLQALTPLLRWAYGDAGSGPLFPLIRVLSCLMLVFVPAAALGATFPLAIRWFATETANPARASGFLYALNTVGAAIGSLLAGFVLIPAIGISGTTLTGVAGSMAAAVLVWIVLGFKGSTVQEFKSSKVQEFKGSKVQEFKGSKVQGFTSPALAMVVLGLTGFAGLVHEIAWTRVLALVLGPTIYAFAATLAAVISGIAIGSGLGSWLVGRSRRPALWLAIVLIAAAFSAGWTYALAGTEIPRIVARNLAAGPQPFEQRLQQGVLLTTMLILPTALCLGAAFPLGLSIATHSSTAVARRFGMVYAANTVGAVCGALAAGFVLIPLLGLQLTLAIVSAILMLAAIVVLWWGRLARTAQLSGAVATVAAAALVVLSPPWDRELLASGAYLYAPYVPKDLDLEALLKAGTLLYYREGGAATVSVKRLTGTTTLAVDGKTDASNRGDMLTQKLAAHLPLLVHEQPREVAIIGLGSGVTVGAALRHPISRADVIEISPEVVEASQHFATENKHALGDPRTNLIVGDGRSHLLLTSRHYDVIVSEPSNPWIAGVASLFTQEFFRASRERLAPGGILCQWANAYNISEADLRAIVATFTSVFPDGTAWLIGADDLLLLGSNAPIEPRLANVARHWNRQGVAADLAEVSVLEPFGIWSLYVAGPAELSRYGAGAPVFTDDRMTLEFSAPRELHNRAAGENSATLAALLGPAAGPPAIQEARQSATAIQWRNRAAMMTKRDAHGNAYDDYVRALQMAPTDQTSLDGFTQTAILLERGPDALSWINSLNTDRVPAVSVLVAKSKLLASIGAQGDAVSAARQAIESLPVQPVAAEQLASLFADAGDIGELDSAVAMLQDVAPDRPVTFYYAAVAAFLKGDPTEALRRGDQAIRADAQYAPVHDVMGAAHLKLGDPAQARAAFQRSLRLNARDSTAYTNLGLIELASGNNDAARRYFAEALWLEPDSPTARDGLAESGRR